jgi:hypothetical protein
MFQTKVIEKIKTHILCSIIFPENSAVYEIMWKKYGRARQATDDNIIRRMRFACWITKATDTHSEYVIVNSFPRQWLRERASMLRYTYIACLVFVVCCVGSGLCNELITRSEESYQVCFSNCECSRNLNNEAA